MSTTLTRTTRTRTIKNVDLFAAGRHTDSLGREREWSLAELDQVVDNFKAGVPFIVPIKLGHSSPEFATKVAEGLNIPDIVLQGEGDSNIGAASLGKVTNIHRQGNKLVGDIEAPESVTNLVKQGLFTGVSSELASDYKGNGPVMSGLAILGAQRPALGNNIKSLSNVTILDDGTKPDFIWQGELNYQADELDEQVYQVPVTEEQIDPDGNRTRLVHLQHHTAPFREQARTMALRTVENTLRAAGVSAGHIVGNVIGLAAGDAIIRWYIGEPQRVHGIRANQPGIRIIRPGGTNSNISDSVREFMSRAGGFANIGRSISQRVRSMLGFSESNNPNKDIVQLSDVLYAEDINELVDQIVEYFDYPGPDFLSMSDIMNAFDLGLITRKEVVELAIFLKTRISSRQMQILGVPDEIISLNTEYSELADSLYVEPDDMGSINHDESHNFSLLHIIGAVELGKLLWRVVLHNKGKSEEVGIYANEPQQVIKIIEREAPSSNIISMAIVESLRQALPFSDADLSDELYLHHKSILGKQLKPHPHPHGGPGESIDKVAGIKAGTTKAGKATLKTASQSRKLAKPASKFFLRRLMGR